MMLAFVIIAGTLAAAAAVVLLWPLVRRRSDSRPASPVAALVATFAILLGGAALYAALSNFQWSQSEEVGTDSPAAMTARLAKRLAAEPENLEGWLMLGRSYVALEQFPLAVRAYQRADRLAGGQNVEAVVGVAESLIAQDPSQLEGPAGRLFERALEISPNYPKAVFYAAFAALARGDLPLARDRFLQMLALNPPPEVRGIIETRIAALDAQMSGGSQAAAGTKSSGDGQASADARILVHVTLAPELAAKVPPDATLFVAARDPAAPGPPFAVKRLQAKFPLDVELSPADAMLESRQIQSGQKLEVVARIALGGTPTATRGDPFGQVGYHVGRDGRLNIVIDRLAP